MEGKLRQLMKHEGINSTRLAEILGIQASGISHIMSGRNKPSFDFLLKLLQRFPQINPDWLLLDKGPMYRDEIKNKAAGSSSGTKNAGASGNSGSAVASGGLFGPDNADIIPSAGPGHAGGSNFGLGIGSGIGSGIGLGPDPGPGHQNGQSGSHSGGYADHSGTHTGLQNAQHPPQMQQHSPQAQQQPLQPVMQQAMYQSGGFTKSASIERIVVFYKDKTFSEYQPE